MPNNLRLVLARWFCSWPPHGHASLPRLWHHQAWFDQLDRRSALLSLCQPSGSDHTCLALRDWSPCGSSCVWPKTRLSGRQNMRVSLIPNGTLVLTEALDEGRCPAFHSNCYLDVGLKRTSTVVRVCVWWPLKGASDWVEFFIPHFSHKRFPGYDAESKELDAETLKKYIFGGHVRWVYGESGGGRWWAVNTRQSFRPFEPADTSFRFKKQFFDITSLNGVGFRRYRRGFPKIAYAAIREEPDLQAVRKDTKTGRQSVLSTRSTVSHTKQRKTRHWGQNSSFQRPGGDAYGQDADDEERRVDVCILSLGLVMYANRPTSGYS